MQAIEPMQRVRMPMQHVRMRVIAPQTPAPIEAEEERRVLEAGTSRAAAEVAAAPAEQVAVSVEGPVDTADQALAPQAVVAHQAWDPEGADHAVAAGADKVAHTRRKHTIRSRP